jgi:hypothetical protein
MSRDYFSILGLSPGRYAPREIFRRFSARRRQLLDELDDPARYAESRRQLDELHRAYNVLRDPQRQADHARVVLQTEPDDDRAGQLRDLIEASLEGGLLRYSRREQILAEGRRLGFSPFHTQLMIAQVQFGGRILASSRTGDSRSSVDSASRIGARFAAAGVLALAIFLAMVRWLGSWKT